jgi:hypothetical protein
LQESEMNIRDIRTEEFARRAEAYSRACAAQEQVQVGIPTRSRRQFLGSASAALLGTALGLRAWRPRLAAAHGNHEPVPIPGGTPILGGAYHVYGPGLPGFDPVDAEPSSITDFNGFIGLAFINGLVTRTNTQTGEVRTLPFVNSDMRFMKGTFRGADGNMHNAAFAFV